MQQDRRTEQRERNSASRAEWVLSFVGLGCLIVGGSGITGGLSVAIFAVGMLVGFVVMHMTCARLSLRIPAEFGFFIIIPMMAILAVALFPMFARMPHPANYSACRNNQQMLYRAMTMYAEEWNGLLPPCGRWNDAIRGSLPDMTDPDASRLLRCPSAGKGSDPSYALNGRLEGKRLRDVGKDTVLLFECTPGRNRSGGQELLPPGDMHTDGINILFADGTVKCLHQSKIRDLRW